MVSSFPRSLWAISEYWCQIDSLEQIKILEGDILFLQGPNPKFEKLKSAFGREFLDVKIALFAPISSCQFSRLTAKIDALNAL